MAGVNKWAPGVSPWVTKSVGATGEGGGGVI